MQSSTQLSFGFLAVQKLERRTSRMRALALLLGILLGTTVLRAQQASDGADSEKQTIQMLVRRVEQLEARVAQLEAESGLDRKAALKQAARERGLGKREAYKQLLLER